MGEFVAKYNWNRKHYIAITKKAFNKLLSFGASLRAYTLRPTGRNLSTITYYDTPENLLQRTGRLFYKTSENGKCFFKLEKLSFLPKTLKKNDEQIFVHEISQRDTPEEHSLYLIDAITSMFSTQFRIDLENVIKSVRPKLVIEIRADVYKVYGGTGFKCDMALENVVYRNFETKRKVKCKEVTFTLDSPQQFRKNYDEFLALVNKHCKDIVEMNESRYEHAKNLTKPITPVDKKNLQNYKKQKEKYSLKYSSLCYFVFIVLANASLTFLSTNFSIFFS